MTFIGKARLIAAVILAICCMSDAMAQTSRRDSLRHAMRLRVIAVDSMMAVRRQRTNSDTTYIRRPDSRFTIKVRANISGMSVKAEDYGNDGSGSADISTDNKATISVGVNYRGIAAGAALNPASLSGRNKDYEVNLNAYSNLYGVDMVYQWSKTLSGTVNVDGNDYFLERGFFDMKMLSINGYYAFNGRRFSYPAAFTQSYIQRHSAGSWLAGFSYLGGRLKVGSEDSEYNDYAIYMGHLGIGGGYGYNFVLHGNWLIHISALPTLVVANFSNIKVEGEHHDATFHFPHFILAERAAVVYNFSERNFVGATMVMTNSLQKSGSSVINLQKWRVRLSFGHRF